MRNVLKSRDLAVVVLMDLSESTNESMQGSDKTVLQLTREAATLVSTAINGIGDPFMFLVIDKAGHFIPGGKTRFYPIPMLPYAFE